MLSLLAVVEAQATDMSARTALVVQEAVVEEVLAVAEPLARLARLTQEEEAEQDTTMGHTEVAPQAAQA